MTQSEAATEKQRIRKEVRFRLNSITALERQKLSAEAAEVLTASELWPRARTILGYVALKDELDLFPVLQAARRAGKTVALPRYDSAEQVYCAALLENESDLVQAGFGILEPPPHSPVVPLNQLDFILVPGLAFDPWGRRLGRGKGFYDRLLARVNGIKCGVALDEQVVKQLPAEPHDITMNLVLTPTRWLTMPQAGT